MLLPKVFGRDDVSFFGVFDGTVGDHAADYVHTSIVEHICGSKVGSRRRSAGVGASLPSFSTALEWEAASHSHPQSCLLSCVVAVSGLPRGTHAGAERRRVPAPTRHSAL